MSKYRIVHNGLKYKIQKYVKRSFVVRIFRPPWKWVDLGTNSSEFGFSVGYYNSKGSAEETLKKLTDREAAKHEWREVE